MARVSVRGLLRSGALTEHDLTAGQGLVLLALADHAGADGVSFPSQEVLAVETGLSRLGVRNAVHELVERGLVEIVEAGGPRRSARYRVTIGTQLRATG